MLIHDLFVKRKQYLSSFLTQMQDTTRETSCKYNKDFTENNDNVIMTENAWSRNTAKEFQEMLDCISQEQRPDMEGGQAEQRDGALTAGEPGT